MAKPTPRASAVTNVDHPLPVTDDTLFQIGSISKTFTGTLLMRLVEQGKLDLDTPIRTYLPDFKLLDEDVAANATIRHLLTHTGNWVGDFFIDTGEGDDAPARYVARMAELPQLAPLGTVFSYNNAGFYLAGHLIETITGQTYEEVLHELLLDPLDMAQVYLKPTDVMTRRFATGHRVEEDTAIVMRPWPLPRAVQPVGGIITNVQELLRYASFHMSDGAITNDAGEQMQLLSRQSIATMQTPQFTIWGKDEFIGLSWFLDDADGVRCVSHGGGTTGQISLFAMVPEHKFALAIVTNAMEGGTINRAVYRWAIAHYLGATPFEHTPIASSSAKLAEYVGRYERPMVDLTLTLEGDKLSLQMTPKQGFPTEDVPPRPPPPPSSFVLCAEDRLLGVDGPAKDGLIDVFRDNKGQVQRIRMGRIHNREAQ